MDQLLTAFGIDAKLIIVQMVNFVVLMGLLTYFLYKPLLRILQEREDKITQGIKDAESAATAKFVADSEKQTILTAAHKEAEGIHQRAKHSADKTAEDIHAEARHKAEQLIVKAEVSSADLKAKAIKESETEISKLAVLAAEKVLREQHQ